MELRSASTIPLILFFFFFRFPPLLFLAICELLAPSGSALFSLLGRCLPPRPSSSSLPVLPLLLMLPPLPLPLVVVDLLLIYC